jgi:hypothetical protein
MDREAGPTAPETRQDQTSPLEAALAIELAARYGPVVGGVDLARLLGFRTSEAMRQSFKRGALSLPLVELQRRRGKFAFTQDVAAWLASQRRGRVQPVYPAAAPPVASLAAHELGLATTDSMPAEPDTKETTM